MRGWRKLATIAALIWWTLAPSPAAGVDHHSTNTPRLMGSVAARVPTLPSVPQVALWAILGLGAALAMSWVKLPALEDAAERAAALLRARAPFLVVGESGTGKGALIAEAARRAELPGVQTLNCAALTADLVRAELFGTEPGAFTGASSRPKPGLIERLDGRALFLDEIHTAPDIQPVLLRVAQDGEGEVVGPSGKVATLTGPLVFATNLDPREAVARGLLREDLYWRMGTAAVRLQPLREWSQDHVTTLAQAFYEAARAQLGDGGDDDDDAPQPGDDDDAPQLSDDALALIHGHHWPGNVRELQCLIERAVLLSKDGRLDLDLVRQHIDAHRGWGAGEPNAARSFGRTFGAGTVENAPSFLGETHEDRPNAARSFGRTFSVNDDEDDPEDDVDLASLEPRERLRALLARFMPYADRLGDQTFTRTDWERECQRKKTRASKDIQLAKRMGFIRQVGNGVNTAYLLTRAARDFANIDSLTLTQGGTR